MKPAPSIGIPRGDQQTDLSIRVEDGESAGLSPRPQSLASQPFVEGCRGGPSRFVFSVFRFRKSFSHCGWRNRQSPIAHRATASTDMRNRNEFVQLIDRYRLGQAQRLSIGSSLSPDFRCLRSSLVLAEGRGKFLRVQWIESRETPIPDAIANACCQAVEDPEYRMREFSQLRVDLTRSLATGINPLAAVSGVNANMLMGVCIDEPGIWIADYDGHVTWQSFCQPEILAEVTGLTVVDALPSRDLAAGGRGGPLGPLPAWLIFADRNSPIAEQPRLLVNFDRWTECTWLPESDGLDDELPEIRYEKMLGGRFEQRLRQRLGEDFPSIASAQDTHLSNIGVDQVPPALTTLFDDFSAQHDLNRMPENAEPFVDLVDAIVDCVRSEGLSHGHVLQALTDLVVGSVANLLDRCPASSKISWISAGNLQSDSRLVNALQQRFEVNGWDGHRINFTPQDLPSVTAAICGLMHIDQMPVTIPWISGSELPRVLGRLTPGSPAHWRRVIMDMGDCRPPVMKLREAV